jgi:hypothetical protein
MNKFSSNKKQISKFKSTFRTKTGEVRTYCGHKLQNKIRNSQDIVSRSRYFQFPDETNHLLKMIYNWRAEDFIRNENPDLTGGVVPLGGGGGGGGGDEFNDNSSSLHTLSITSSKLEIQAEELRNHTHQHNKLLKQRALAIHLLLYTISNKFSLQNMDRRSLETFLDVGESSDADILMNSALAISNLTAHPSLRPLLLELNCIHRYSSFLPLLTTPHTSLGGGLFLYYMSCETEVEDRLCSAGFKTLQKNSLSDNFTLRLLTLQCLSNLMPCQERIRIAELVVTTLHHMYRDYLDDTWNEEILLVLLHVTSFTNCLRIMIEADIMDIISLAAAEVRENILCGRLIARILSHFLHQLDLGEDLVHADFSRIFIDLLSLDDSYITELCMHAFAVLSSHDQLIHSVSDSDIVHIVCGYIASSTDTTTTTTTLTTATAADTLQPRPTNTSPTSTLQQLQVIEDIARYLCNISQPSSKFLHQRVHDGVAHALLDLFRLCPHNDHIQQYAIIGIRDLLTNLENCVTLSSLMTPALIGMLQLNVDEKQKLDVNVVQCVYNICLSTSCHDYLTHVLEVDVVLLDILRAVYQRESVSVIKALIQVLIILADMKLIVSRLIAHDTLEFLLVLVQYSSTPPSTSASGHSSSSSGGGGGGGGAREDYKECWNDISRLLLVMIHSQPSLTIEQETCIVKILPIIGTKSSSEEIITDCAIILAFLSYTLQDFTIVDPIVRSIIHLSENDHVMDATSTVLYNISCNLDNSSMLLSDSMLHVNIMIKMMRNGNIRIQQNIAETMKLLCIHSKCNELLLKYDLLSDFIVIALLRTNSSHVKKVCSESFYNMLCHHTTRTRLLSGDLWWAMMRLSKTDLSSVRMICSKAVYNLTCDPMNIKSLRKNYILSFIKEIAFEEDGQEYQDIFLHVLYHILRYTLPTLTTTANTSSTSSSLLQSTHVAYTTSRSLSTTTHESPPLMHTEMVAIIQILINGISKSHTIESSQWIGYLLAIVAKESLETKEINEFIHMDLISMLKIGSSVWIHDMTCRRYFSTVLSLLCSQYSFTNATLIIDMLPILSILMNHEQDMGNGEIQPLPLDQMICENITAILLSYATRQQIDVITMISIPFFTTLMTYAVTTVSPYKQHMQRLQSMNSFSAPSASTSQLNEIDNNNTIPDVVMIENAMVDQPVSSLCVLFLKLLVFILPKLFDPNLGLGSRMTHRSFYSKKSPAIETIYKVRSAIPMKGFMNLQLYLHDLTRSNTLFILQTIGTYEEKVKELLQLNFFSLLHTLLLQHKLHCHSSQFLEFCSIFSRNISSFSGLHPLLVASRDIDRFLFLLIKYDPDGTGGGPHSGGNILVTKKNSNQESTQVVSRLYDLTVVMYQLAQSRLHPSSVMSPQAMLNLITETMRINSESLSDNLLTHITKLIIGLVVDKTEDGSGFDPSFIRAILSEINDEDSLDEAQIAEFMKPKPVHLTSIDVDMTSLPAPAIEPLVSSSSSGLPLTKEQIDALWVPIISNERKKMEYFPVIHSNPVQHTSVTIGGTTTTSTIDPVLPFPMAVYEKIVKRYDYVTEPVLIEAKREREEKLFSLKGGADNELGVLEEEVEDFPNMTTLDPEEGGPSRRSQSELRGMGSRDRDDSSPTTVPSPGHGNAFPLSPRPPEFASPRSTPTSMKSGRSLVQSKSNNTHTATSLQRETTAAAANESIGSPRKRTTSS